MKKRRAVKKAKPVVAKVKLPVRGIVRVAIPKGVVPVVAVDHVKRVVEIVPVKQKTWWQSIFGG